MDLPAEFYLQTVDVVFQRHLLPKSQMKWRDPLTDRLHDVLPSKIERTALLTIEGELDDISARGRTTAAHDLCYSFAPVETVPPLPDLVSYGIFNGRKWKS